MNRNGGRTMPEPSSREINDKIAEIREWLVRIDTKMDYMSEVKRVADDAKTTADEAKQLSVENREDIRDMKANTKWLWGFVVSVTAIVVTIGIAVFS
jgi:archaellum component FlaC